MNSTLRVITQWLADNGKATRTYALMPAQGDNPGRYGAVLNNGDHVVFSQFTPGRYELLRYIGAPKDGKLAQHIFAAQSEIGEKVTQLIA